MKAWVLRNWTGVLITLTCSIGYLGGTFGWGPLWTPVVALLLYALLRWWAYRGKRHGA